MLRAQMEIWWPADNYFWNADMPRGFPALEERLTRCSSQTNAPHNSETLKYVLVLSMRWS